VKHFLPDLQVAVIAVVVLFLLARVEPMFFPVVMNWTVSQSLKSKDSSFYMAGFMNKVRGCEFIAVTVKDQNNITLPIKFLDNSVDDSENRPTGSQKWGYWSVQIRDDSSELTLKSRHNCHAMWDTITTLGTISVYPKANQ